VLRRNMRHSWQCTDLDDHHGEGIHVGLSRHPEHVRCRFGIPIEDGEPLRGHPPNGSSAVYSGGMCRLRIGSYGRQGEIAQDCILGAINEDVGLCVSHERRSKTHFFRVHILLSDHRAPRLVNEGSSSHGRCPRAGGRRGSYTCDREGIVIKSLTNGRRSNRPTRLRNSEIFPSVTHLDTMHNGLDSGEMTPRNERMLGWERFWQTTISLHHA